MIVLIGAGSLSFAEDISVTAEVDTHTVQAGSPVLLMVTVKGADSVDPLDLPEMKGFQGRYLGPRTEISIVNGRSNRSISFMYNLYALAIGHFEIPAIPVTVDNKIYTTQPVPIEVVDQVTASSRSPGQDNEGLKDKIFLVINVPNKEYFVNEKIPISFKLYIAESEQINLASNIDFKRQGFDIDEIVDSARSRDMVGGEYFNVLEFKTFVYPRQAGELTLGPAQVLAKIRVENSSRTSPFRDMPSIFNDDFFNNFFSENWREQMVKSADISLKVLPPPEEGRPKGFSGGVGKFNFDVSVSPSQVAVGDPITLRMKISGEGNLKNVNFPQITDPHFKFYDPQIHEDKGEKIFEQVVIPTTDEIKEFPAVSFFYFDTKKRQYETITKGPFPLKVTKSDNAPAKVIGNNMPEPLAPPVAQTLAPEKLGRGISFIKDTPGTFRPAGPGLHKNPVFLSVVFILALLWLAALAAYYISLKFKTDAVFARRFLAPHKARKHVSEAKHYLAKGEQREFYGRLFKTLQDYLASRSHQKSAAMTIENIENLLNTMNMNQDTLKDIKAFLQECEMVRFASIKVSKEKMATSFIKVQEIIDYLERNWS